MSGWIKIHRNIVNHWLYTEKRVFSKYEAWNDILLTVNYTDGKSIIKGNLYEVKRGQSILSLESWSKRWNWDKSKVRRFLKTLQDDNMIVIKSDTVTTQLTVCNYDSYQSEKTISETQTKHKRNADETQTTLIEERKKERKKEINNNILSNIIVDKFDFKKSLIENGVNEKVASDYILVRKAKKAPLTETAFQLLFNEIKKHNLIPNDVIEICIEKNWIGFKNEWIENKLKPHQNATSINFSKPTITERTEAARQRLNREREEFLNSQRDFNK